jgi:hypothetical protein
MTGVIADSRMPTSLDLLFRESATAATMKIVPRTWRAVAMRSFIMKSIYVEYACQRLVMGEIHFRDRRATTGAGSQPGEAGHFLLALPRASR